MPDGRRALVIGPMKAGTTWIHDYLAARGDVCLPSGVKETFYFDRYYERGRDWYSNHFRHWDAQRHRIMVEVAPSLFHAPEAAVRVRDDLGSVPLLVVKRDPIARSWSHYMHLRRYGYTNEPLAGAIEAFPQIINASRYEEQIARWRATLPDAPLTVLELDLLKSDPEAYVRQLCEALGIPFKPIPEMVAGEANSAAVPPSFLAAKAGRRISYALRSMGLYGVISLAKAIGLKPLFFGEAGKGMTPRRATADEQALLAERLGLGKH